MKSNKQRRAEIKARRLERAADLKAKLRAQDARQLSAGGLVPGMAMADKSRLSHYNTTFGEVPDFYLDQAYTCRDCGAQEVWTAKQQKWWHEVAQGAVYSRAVRCRACRQARRALRDAALRNEGANLLGDEVARLRALATKKSTDDSLAQVEAALQSKWRSLRVVAIEVMGQWGGPAQIERLQAFAADRGDSYGSWEYEASRAAARALARKVEADREC
jgi:hypothetical protein